jgi:addiction module HigA family antidote
MLREDVLPALKRPKTEIADRLGISRQTLYDLLNGKTPVTPNIALRLAKLTGTRAESWLNLQNEFDLLTVDEKLKNDVARIPTLPAAE